MRILVIHEYNFPYGGGEQHLQHTCQALREMGHRVALVCAHDRNHGFLPADACYGIQRSFGLRSGRRVLPSVMEVLAREGPDVVFLNGLGSLFISPHIIGRIVRRWPTASYVHHLDVICPTGRKVVPKDDQPCKWAAGFHCFREGCIDSLDGTRFNALRRAVISLWRMREVRRCRLVIVPSEYVRRECVRNGFPIDRLRILPYFTARGRVPVDEPVGHLVLWVGRVEGGKGLDQFLRSLALLSGRAWQAEVAGDGPGLEDAILLAGHLGLSDRVTFLGRLPGGDLDAHYARSRLLVFTSTWTETFGQVGIEAMAFGRPVVAYDAGGTAEWLEDGQTGFLVPRGDCARMAEHIASLLEDDLLWRRMGTAARRQVECRFRPEQHLLRLVGAFEEAVRLHRGEPIDVADVA